ncbi:VOC family protein [Hydrogenophaga sp. 5NK40-0174]|uniref:VOC family protein n=1 Tax=Hydrogenophaga sp. 5NK40-0174 TaxID=3127649 RepID=UPI0031054B4F
MSQTIPMCPVMHFEMPYKDAARAARFYAEAMGWQTQMLGEEMGHYLLVTTATAEAPPPAGPGAVPGVINGGLFPFKPDWPMQHPSVVMGVEDITAAMARIKSAGGEVLGEPMDIPGVGTYVAFVDTEGNRNSILQPSGGQDCPAG